VPIQGHMKRMLLKRQKTLACSERSCLEEPVFNCQQPLRTPPSCHPPPRAPPPSCHHHSAHLFSIFLQRKALLLVPIQAQITHMLLKRQKTLVGSDRSGCYCLFKAI
jgi:hypothetical protein